MGVFRLLLAGLVVLFHFGGLSWIVGRVAVYAFYCISGFLIFQVLDRVYLGERFGVARFAANRFVRLAPLYLACAGLTAGLLLAGGRFAAGLRAADVPIAGATAADLLRRTIAMTPAVSRDGRLPILAFEPPLLPQGWSIGVEVTFYLIAPLVVLMTRRRPLWLAAWVIGALVLTLYGFRVAGVDFERFQADVYKNALTSATMFFLGGACYYVRRQWGPMVSPAVAWTSVAVWLAIITIRQFHGGSFPLPSASVFAEYLWLTLLVSCLMLLSAPPQMRAVDRLAGNLCYGVYLNHFIVAALVLPILPGRLADSGAMTPGILVLTGSIALAALTYLLVEYPFDVIRARVRRVSIPIGQIPNQRPRPAWVAGVAVVTAMLAGSAGWTVERLNGAAAGVTLPVSGPFHIRWKPDVTDARRRQIEAEFGLTVDGPDKGDSRHRTYQYRLPQPTRDRVHALVTDSAVEDTARVDVQRYEIAQ